MAISPDGRQLAFVAQSLSGRPSIWVRALEASEARALPGTEDAIYPFWSPDSRSLGFFAQGKLKVVDLAGAPPRTLADAGLDSRGGTWSRNGTILFAPANGPLSRIAAAGGTVSAATRLDESRAETAHRFPAFLPDDRHFLYASRTRDSRPETLSVSIGSLDGAIGRPLIERTAQGAQFAPSGHVLFLRMEP
jgi:eukaryotic-like serine/threonine-protein kinase